MSELLRFFKDMRDNGYGLAEIAAQLGTSAIAEPVAGFAAMYDPVHGADAIREGMTYTPRTQEAQQYSQSVGNAASAAIKPAMPIIDTWKKGVDIAGQYSPVVGAGLRTVPAAIGIAMGAKPALQAGRQVSEGLGAMQGRMIANATAPSTLNTAGFRGQRGVFAGINALTADKEALAKAQEMIRQGVDPAQVWKETGWGKGVDGKWRFEINDSGSSLNMMNFPEAGDAGITSYLPEFLKHPQVYQNYPESKTMGVLAKNGYGDSQMRGGINGLMVVNSAGGDTAKSTVLHELQHAIQQKEGFASGGSPQTVNQSIFRENQAKYFDDLITQLEEKLPKPNQQWIDDIHDPIEAQIEKIKEQKYNLSNSNVGFDAYRSLAGEVEARTTQSRMDLNAQQRRENYPFDYKTYGYDVPAKSQTVDFGNNKANAQRTLNTGYMGQRGAIGLTNDFDNSDEIKIIADYLGQSPESMLVNRDLYTKKQGAINSLVSRYEQMDDFSGAYYPTSYGYISISPSAKSNGQWQLTSFDKKMNPLSDQGEMPKNKALTEFFKTIKPNKYGNITPVQTTPKRPLTEFEQAHATAPLLPATALGAYMYNEKRKKSQGNQ